MPKRIHKVVLDSNKSTPLFEINKLDSLHLEVEVTEVETLENAEVELFFKKSDGTLVSEIISEKEQNILKIDVKNGALDVPGIVVGQAKITEEDGNISSHMFKFNIKNSITSDDAIVNEMGIGAIEELKKQIDNAQVDPEVLKTKIEETINTGDLDVVSKEELKQVNSQLEHKANKNETSNLQEQINNLVLESGGDSNLEVVQARGRFSTLNERLENLDFTKLRNVSTNLISTPDFVSIGKNGATYEQLDDLTYKVTCNESWGGRFNHRIKASYNRKYMIICKVKAGNDASIGQTCWLTPYQYDHLQSDLGQITIPDNNYYTKTVRLTSTSEDTLFYCAVTVSHANTAYLDLGISSSQNTTFVLSECIILDVTPLTFEEIKSIDFPKYGYWAKCIENFGVSQYSSICGEALDLNDDIKQNIINESISKSLSAPFIDETLKLAWTTKSYSSGESLSWWVENKTNDLLPNSKYVFIVKWNSTTQVPFQKCNELRNGAWYDKSTITQGTMNNTNTKVVAWMFNTDEKTSPILCLVTNSGTLSSNVDITVELYRIDDDSYINQDVAIKLATAYRDGHTVKDYDFSDKIKWSDVGVSDETIVSKWKGKNALVIGDSITAANQWQNKLNTELGMQVKTHAKGGVGIVAMVDGDKGLGGNYDNETNAGGTLQPLNTNDVSDKDLIVVLPAYNERGITEGIIGDCYNPDTKEGNTITGKIQYLINRLYEELTKSNNLNCKILIATPHCAGKYNYIDADGYEEYPKNSGRTMETLANTIKQICNYNNIPVCDLWHNSGINKFTWNIYGASPNPVNSNYTKYELNAQGEVIGSTPMRYVTGSSYYQLRDGQVVLEEYTGSAPYPFNGDQLHCSNLGYARIGECIVGSIIRAYGY